MVKTPVATPAIRQARDINLNGFGYQSINHFVCVTRTTQKKERQCWRSSAKKRSDL
jgi:hypothetical protein